MGFFLFFDYKYAIQELIKLTQTCGVSLCFKWSLYVDIDAEQGYKRR